MCLVIHVYIHLHGNNLLASFGLSHPVPMKKLSRIAFGRSILSCMHSQPLFPPPPSSPPPPLTCSLVLVMCPWQQKPQPQTTTVPELVLTPPPSNPSLGINAKAVGSLEDDKGDWSICHELINPSPQRCIVTSQHKIGPCSNCSLSMNTLKGGEPWIKKTN